MKRLYQFSIVLLLIISASCQSSSKENKNLRLLQNSDEISSLAELINLPEFKNKILYINQYSFYCKHSLDEFAHLKKLQKHLQTSKLKNDIVYIHLSTPKWGFEPLWKLNVDKYKLSGYHFLMNEKFYNDFWSYFPESKRRTPFFVEVTKDGKISKINRPSTVLTDRALNVFNLKTFNFIRTNLDSILAKHPKKSDLLFRFDQSSKPKISFFTYSKNQSENSKEVKVWKGLRSYVVNSFDSISNNTSISKYSFAIPLKAGILDSLTSIGIK